ncbi:uncharacterized protein LOC117337378 [Pecten maximus]|uniref:uncharacterized protein LOC117337378 n=1 Tax=Pecten maximus TaxID=6579 RepID=UPI0014582357|nr:uncharacterized protein LOC117337378 [Pecten maximus]
MSSKPPKKKYIDGLDKVTYDRYAQKTKDIGVDPYEVPKQKFNSDHKNLPAIVYIDILNYLVTSTSAYTYEQLRAFKSLDAYNQFVNGWVTDVKSLAANDKVLVTGRVRHSQRMNDTPLRPWVIASPSGIIDCAHCDCMAGLGEACTHVGALLFYSMEAYRLSKEKTVTQDKAYWLLPSSLDKVPYSEIRDIDFTTAETQKKQRDSVQNGGSVCKRNTLKLPEVPEPTADDISGFMEALFVTKSKASVCLLNQHTRNILCQMY